MQIYWNRRKCTATWRPVHCCGTPIWLQWRHVHTLHTDGVANETRQSSFSRPFLVPQNSSLFPGLSGIKWTKLFIIRCVFFFLSIGRESTTWPANNCLRIMVCSCVVPSRRVLLRIIFCSCVIGTTFSREKLQIASLRCQEVIKIWKQTWWSNDKTIIELGYRKISWFVNGEQINYSSARHWQITIFCSPSSNNC